MRLAMLPPLAGCLLCVYRLGARCYGREAALWAVLATGYLPVFFHPSTEFRPDTLSANFWLLSLTILLTGTPTFRRLFLFRRRLRAGVDDLAENHLSGGHLAVGGAANFLRRPPASHHRRAGGLEPPGGGGGRGFCVGAGVLAGVFLLPGRVGPSGVLPGHSQRAGRGGGSAWLAALAAAAFAPAPAAVAGGRAGRSAPVQAPAAADSAGPYRCVAGGALLSRRDAQLLSTDHDPGLLARDSLVALAAAGRFFQFDPARCWIRFLPPALILGELLALSCIHGRWRDRTARSASCWRPPCG